MKYYIIIAIAGLAIVFMASSCKSKKYTTLGEAEGRQITFSYGGGFAGTYKIYTLLENGQLFSSQGKTENFTEITSLDKDLATQIFSNYDVLGFKESKVDDPGNMTYRITSIDGEEKNQIKWTESGEGTELLQRYFDITMKQINPPNVKSADKNFKIK